MSDTRRRQINSCVSVIQIRIVCIKNAIKVAWDHFFFPSQFGHIWKQTHAIFISHAIYFSQTGQYHKYGVNYLTIAIASRIHD